MIRAADASDIEQISEIEKASFDDPWPKSGLGHYVGGSVERMIVFDEGGIKGFTVFSVIDGEVEIYDIAVAPADRKRGVGKALISYALSLAKTAFLEVRESNLAARALYESCGFRAAGIRKKYYSDGENAVVMIWNR